ncbi:MAG: hypothetical protein JWP24_2423 [Marmoricola sp.]|nr:hypothetical protein [Marmoricola sp.]
MPYAPVVAKRVVLHIGAMKSGTSFIQNVLDANRQRLIEHDIVFAGDRWRQQVLAVRELSERGGEGQEPLTADGPWQRLVDIVNAWHGTAIISMEFLAPRQRVKIDIIQKALAGADLQVVLTARDLARSLPSMWTESMQNRGVRTWDEFLESVRTQDVSDKPGRWFWKHQRISEIAERWRGAVGGDHFTLVTVPPKGTPPGVLWERFAGVAGIPEGVCDTDVRSNPGIDAASAMVLRELNERLAADDLSRQDYEWIVKGALAKRGLVQRGRDKVPLGMDERWVRRASRQEVRKLKALGLRVVGDVEELESQPVDGVHTRKVTAEQQLEAALDGMAFLVTQQAERGRRGRGNARDEEETT